MSDQIVANSKYLPKYSRFTDLSTKKFGRWIVIGYAGKSEDKAEWHQWYCRCACGIPETVYAGDLLTGKSRLCSECVKSGVVVLEESTRPGKPVHKKRPVEYGTWRGARARCENPNNPGYVNYGGRGILMCARWRISFENFFFDMGRKPSSEHSLDRINNDGNYEPGNCRWATAKEQANNRRSHRDATSEVQWDNGAWKAWVKVDGKKIYLGRFSSLSVVAERRKKAEAKYFGG